MSKSWQKRFAIIAPGLAVLIFPISINAQSIWLDSGHGKKISFEYIKPDLAYYSARGLFFSALLPISANTDFVMELPYVHGDHRDYYYDSYRADDAVGNPYLGIQSSSPKDNTSFEIGVRLPLASDEKGTALSPFMVFELDRIGAFYPDYLSFLSMVNFYQKGADGLIGRLRIGPGLMAYTGDNHYADDIEWFINFSYQI